jgi:superfamily II DNA or RNA helicase
MALSYNKDYFMDARPEILDNGNIRQPQKMGYIRAYEHFVKDGNTSTHAIIVLPTGVGKTGLIALLPYGISNGRVLIIAPQTTVKDTVLDGIDTSKPSNFWMRRKVFEKVNDLPALVEYNSDISKEVLDAANIVILNAQKLQLRLNSSPLNFLPEDYFDMIIIDEAHHSTAKTWVDTVQYFSKAKVVKLTGTPIRTDNEKIAGKLIYKYKLSQAMANRYVKSLENIVHIPDELFLTIDGDEKKKYTLDELYAMDDLQYDENWVKRKVAYSVDCSRKIVQRSIELLEQKLSEGNKVPHKIIAVACSVPHALQIKQLYEDEGYPTDVIYSALPKDEKDRVFSNIKNNRIKVIINIAMMGEGYDHPYLSIGAIFRPFKNELPYVQFIGRVLRIIPDNEAKRASDNVAQIVSHHNLGLDELWKKYKVEIQESDIIKHLKDADILEEEHTETRERESIGRNTEDLGSIGESGSGILRSDAYLNTELIKKKHEEDKIAEEKIEGLQNVLGINRTEAVKILRSQEAEKSPLKRPDLYFRDKKSEIDDNIRQVIVPALITKFNLDQMANDLRTLPIFSNAKYRWIAERSKNNGAILATYFNVYLKNELGKAKKDWSLDDYDIAFDKLEQNVEYIKQILTEYKERKS